MMLLWMMLLWMMLLWVSCSHRIKQEDMLLEIRSLRQVLKESANFNPIIIDNTPPTPELNISPPPPELNITASQPEVSIVSPPPEIYITSPLPENYYLSHTC